MLKKFYETKILPKLLNSGMKRDVLGKYRPEVIQDVSGDVLEIGFGSGLNLSYYKSVNKLYALEPSQELFDLTDKDLKESLFPIVHLKSGAENIQLPDNSVDSVVSTWVLCSVENVQEVLQEVKRVLRSGGKLFFIEHGKSNSNSLQIIQKAVTPCTRYFAGNCHLNRDIQAEFEKAGFVIDNLKQEPMKNKGLMFLSWGVAHAR